MRRYFTLICALAVASVGAPSATAGVVTPVGTLTPSPSAEIGTIAVSGTTVIGAGSGKAFVFSKPASGWASESNQATLEDHSGPILGAAELGFDGTTAVLSAGSALAVGVEDVFERPAGGWTGNIAPSAHLVATDGASLEAPAVSGRTIVALAISPGTSERDVYVFVEPAGGWSGTVSPVAQLYDSGGAPLYSVAISGATIVAGSGNQADVFTEPAGGWSGPIPQTAVLTAPHDLPLSSVADVGSTVLAGANIFEQPAGGWASSASPQAELFPAAGTPTEERGPEAFSDTTAAMTATALGAEHQCPCSGTIWLFTRPRDGWSGVVSSAPAGGGPNNNDFGLLPTAIDGTTLFVGGNPSIAIEAMSGSFGAPPHPPHPGHARISGLANGKPKLSVAAVTDDDTPAIETITIKLPRGLTLRRNVRHPLSGVAVRPWTISAHRQSQRLKITLAQPAHTMRVTFGPRALVESKALKNRIKRTRARRHGSRKPPAPKLRVRLVVGQLLNLHTQLAVVVMSH